jgi:hypothetical protein
MQLPRGVFRGIKKGIGLESLLEELKEGFFSGYCKVATEEASATIVLKEGLIVLAHSGDQGGTVALAFIEKWRDREIDAVLHELSTTQLELALEFNPADRVCEPLKNPFPSRTLKEVLKQDPPVRATDVAPPDPGVYRLREPEPKAHQTLSPVLQEFTTLDGMDIEKMSRAFRENCRQIIEKLDLEFLLEPGKQKGGP